jgi:hypothetical protein
LVRIKDGVFLWTSDSPLIDGSTWYYIELSMALHATTGSLELRTNEVTRVALTNIDTTSATAGDTTISGVVWSPGPAFFDIDDIYLNNGAGSVNNSFNGDTSVYRLLPNAAGDLTQFTPSTAPNWNAVNDSNVVDTADYNEGNTVTFTDLYNIENLPAAAAGKQVFGVQLHGVVSSASLPRSGALVIRSGILDTESATIVLSTGVSSHRYIVETKPGIGTSWSTADVDAAQIGVRVKS